MATPGVTSDTFICGSCQTYFSSLIKFLEHKKGTCSSNVSYHDGPDGRTITLLKDGAKSCDEERAETRETGSSKLKKRGRPKKQSDDNSSPAAVKTKSFTIDEDGSLLCELCKNTFKRERHFNSHKCEALGDYVDISKKDCVEGLEEGFSSQAAASTNADDSDSDMDETENYEPYDDDEDMNSKVKVKVTIKENTTSDGAATQPRKRGRPRKSDAANDVKRKFSGDGSTEGKRIKKSSKNSDQAEGRKKKGERQLADYPIPQSLDDIPDVPVFKTKEERLAFEEKNICSIDVTTTDSMFKIHVIEQTMNEHALPIGHRSNGEISLYSCNMCDKVFKSISHIRLHCVTHLDSKPFKCPEGGCDFCSNSKGNIYSHMRKHTGQYYRCRTCEFKCVNKTHLLEHEAIHSGIIRKCEICKKNYSTLKSLVNHIRKYHSDTDEGKQYMTQFVVSKEGPGAALLYECHICDRKFKKQSDRDRHLYVHNVRVEHTVYTCELCQYEGARPSHLEGHFVKHKYVYCCAWCAAKFITVSKLTEHLKGHDLEEIGLVESPINELLGKCIEISLYLPVKCDAAEETTSDVNVDGNSDLYNKLGYVKMTQKIFANLREQGGELECQECGERFKTEESLKAHEENHEGEKPYACSYCEHRTYSKNSLKLHINANHEASQFMCGECNFTAKTKLSLHEHKLKHENTECPICKQVCPGRKMLRNHLLLKHSEIDADSARKLSGYGRRTENMISNQTFKCPYCERSFLHNNAELQKHIWMHEGIRPYKCGICDHSCRTRSNLTSHMLRHTETKPFNCGFCGKKYKSKTALRWHERSHTDGKVFKCDRCNYEALQRSHLKRHMEIHTLIKRYACNHCDFSANTLGYMRIHYTRFHLGHHYTFDANASTKEVTTPTNAKVFKCVSCDFLFGNMSDMKRHLRMRHRIQMADMRNAAATCESLTQIVPLENQDGITSDVQVIQLPVDDNTVTVQRLVQGMTDSTASNNSVMEAGSILVDGNQELSQANLQQLVDFATQQMGSGGDINDEQAHQIVLNYQVSGEDSSEQLHTITNIAQTDDDQSTSLLAPNIQTVHITGSDNSIQTVQITGADNSMQTIQLEGIESTDSVEVSQAVVD